MGGVENGIMTTGEVYLVNQGKGKGCSSKKE